MIGTLSLGPGGMSLMLPPTRAIGLDPGGAATGWGLVEVGADRRETVLDHGVLDIDSPADHLRNLIRQHSPGLVGVEVVEHVHPVRRGGVDGISTMHALALCRASRIAGMLINEAARGGCPVMTVEMEVWRKALAGSRTADDADVERALRLRLQSFPAPRKSNNHERDGIGVALYSLLTARAAPRKVTR